MKTLIIASVVACTLAAPGKGVAQAAPAAAKDTTTPSPSPHTFSGNVALVSDYRFRGISQTFGLPAIQGGLDYSHASGAYLGTWGSNVYAGTNNSGLGLNYFNGGMEWDMYGGYKRDVVKGLNLDAGLLFYYYPGAEYNVPTHGSYNNLDIYLGASYRWFTAKYSYAPTDYFGAKTNTIGNSTGIDPAGVATGVLTGTGSSKGSGYLDVGVAVEIDSSGFAVVAHGGHLWVRNYSPLNYYDWKLGVTKDWLGFGFGLSYIATSGKADVYRTQKQENGSTDNYNTAKGTVVFSVGKKL